MVLRIEDIKSLFKVFLRCFVLKIIDIRDYEFPLSKQKIDIHLDNMLLCHRLTLCYPAHTACKHCEN